MTDRRDPMAAFDLSEEIAPPPATEPIGEPTHPGLHKVPPARIAIWLAEARKKGDGQALPAAEPPDMPMHPDLENATPEVIAAWLAEARKRKGCPEGAPLPAKDKERPVIVVTPGDLPQTVDQGEAALIQAELGFYRRGTTIVKPAMVPIKISDGREIMAQCLTMASPHALAEAFTRAAVWLRPKDEEELTRIDCPQLVARTYASRAGDWRLPMLAGVVNCLTLRADGSILATPGYDQASGLLFDPRGCQFLPVADKPTRDDAKEALQLLREVIRKFPFADNASQSVALSAILTAVVRRTLTSAPLHAFTAPVAGSGKSMLVDLASIVATGHEAAVVEEGDEEELPKRLGAALLAGSQIVTIDNCERPLGGGFLCQALTQPYLSVRILGQSENRIIVPDAFLCATGNNLKLAGDMTRRTILCSLDPQCERPELRAFAFDPIETVKADRPKFVRSALTVLRAYHVVGRPQTVGPTGSFESWSKLVRAALVWLGEEDPWMTTEAVRGGDPKLEALTAVIEQWRAVVGAEPVSGRALIERATQRRPSTGIFDKEEFLYPDLREALLAVAGRGGAISGRALGIWLGQNRGRIVAGSKLERHSTIRGNVHWRLMDA